MNLRKKSAGKFSGTQSEERTLSALAIRIDYQYPLQEHSYKAVGDDVRFSPANVGRPPSPLDPYAVRDAFFAAKDPDSALRFLNDAGIFWPFRDVLWSQFQEWQRFFGWLRQSPEKAMLEPEGAKAWATAEGFKNTFFAEMPSRFPPEAIEEIGPERMREIEVSDRHTLQELRHFALTPERLHGNSISLQWHERTDKTYAPRVPLKKWKGAEHKPFLMIETDNAAEAIAATIYADRVHGVVCDACKHCGKLFEVNSEHGQEFCPRPSWLKKSPCANAYQAQVRRDRDRLKRKKERRRQGKR
jgi:hypothetical protein